VYLMTSRKKGQNVGWRNTVIMDHRKEVEIAEPRHRVGPIGVSSGISHRELPSGCVEQVRQICLHYVSKCAGKYSNNVVAARYVHHMADEVISQLAGVAEQIQRHESNPQLFQKLLDEWNASFPPSLGYKI